MHFFILPIEYNEYGQRIKKYNENSTTKYYYENDLLIRSIKDNVSVDYLYDNNNLLFGFIFGNKDYYYLRDITGNINKIVDSNGLVMVKYTYTTYGQVTMDNMFDTNNPLYQTAEELITHNIFLYKGYCYDVETQLYWVSSRYYSPELCRWISPDSIEYLDPNSINGLNLYAYCGNDPVNKYDPTGHFGILTIFSIILGIGALASTANDIYQIASGNVYVDMNKTNSENVHIENSYKILTPWMRYGYSFYLNHFNPNTKDVIQGSTAGVQFEWELHNYAAWLGIGGDSAKHLDVGKSIFADGKTHPLRDEYGNITATGAMSLGMRIVYIWFGNPIYWIWDLIVNGGF